MNKFKIIIIFALLFSINFSAFADVKMKIANAYMKQEKWAEAIEALQKSTDTDAKVWLALAYNAFSAKVVEGDVDIEALRKSVDYSEEAYKLFPEKYKTGLAVSLNNLGTNRNNLGVKQSESLMKSEDRKKSDYKEIDGLFKEGSKAIKRARRLAPDNEVMDKNLALLYENWSVFLMDRDGLGDIRKAERILKEAQELRPSKNTLIRLGDLFIQKGDENKAIEYYEMSEEL